MFPIPRYSEEPTTLFLERLKGAGFFGWYTFDLSNDRSSLWKAMALGLLQHTQMNYPRVQGYLEAKWKPKIAELSRVDRPGDRKYEDPQYWGALGETCEHLVLNFFRDSGKTAHLEEIQRTGYLSPSNKAAYNLLTFHFNLCLCWYESLAENQVMTHVFHSQSKGDVSLFICIAQEGNRLYYLYHNSGRGPVKLDFPFAMKVGDGTPLIIEKSDAPQEEEDVRSVVIRKLVEVADSQAEFLLAICLSVPPEAKEKYMKMLGKVQAAKAYISLRHLEVNLSTPSLQSVQNLPDFEPIRAKDPHSVLTCEQYPEDQDWLNYHGHYFHRTCLSNYLLEISLEYPNMPKCPLNDCPLQLPDTVLDLNLGIREAYERSRLRVNADMQALQQYRLLQGSASVPASSYNLTCTACCRTNRRYYFLQHGCEICLYCAYQTGGQDCPGCNARLTFEEMTLISKEGQRSWC